MIIIVFGLHLMGVFQLLPLLSEKRLHLADKPAGYAGTLAVGAAFGAGWTPCIGPVLGAIMTMAASQEHVGTGMLLLFVYSLGLAVPFMLAAVALESFLQRLLPLPPVPPRGAEGRGRAAGRPGAPARHRLVRDLWPPG